MSEPWLERWQEGRIGWHEAEGNRSLKRHWSKRGLRVLVPFCGKSHDLAWLEAQGNDVVGVELSDIAARSFFEEHGLAFQETGNGRFVCADRQITIVCGDYFEFADAPFDAHYDRGALAALPPDHRGRYAAHTNSLLSADAYQLIIVLEYDQSLVDGPPFAIYGDEIRSYWPGLERVDAYDDIDNCPPKFLGTGLSEMLEVVWRSR